MTTSNFDLDRLLAPLRPATFLEHTWEKEPLHLQRNDPHYYEDVFSSADVDQVIAFTRPQFPGASFAAAAARTYVQGCLPDQPASPSTHVPDVADVRQQFAAGKTVVIRSMQFRWRAIALLCRSIEAGFQCPVHANLYMTPARSQGFEPHIDTHEVLVLQLDGRKTWRLYGQTSDRPLPTDPTILTRAKLGSPTEVRLEPGDLLYLPRGYAHEAFTDANPSLHLTVGVNVFRWLDILHEALEIVAHQDGGFRDSLSPDALLSNQLPSEMSQTFQRLVRSFSESAALASAMRQLADRFFASLHPLPDGSLAFDRREAEASLDSILFRRPGVICRFLIEGEMAIVEFPGGRVGGPMRVAPALKFIADNARFSVREMPELGEEAKLVLARRAIREGLLMVADPNLPSPSLNGRAHRPLVHE